MKAFKNIGAALALLVLLAMIPIIAPIFSVCLFHYQALKAVREHQITKAVIVFVLACLPVDAGLMMMAHWAYGKYLISN
jgi:hypothetical protein